MHCSNSFIHELFLFNLHNEVIHQNPTLDIDSVGLDSIDDFGGIAHWIGDV